MLRRAVGSLLARRWRFSPRATPTTRSVHSLKDLPIRYILIDASIIAAGGLAGFGIGALAFRHSKKGIAASMVTENKAKIKKPDIEARFERWMAEYNKTYRDEEGKAMRFELFKVALERTESRRPPAVQESLLPEISYMADYTDEERRKICPIPTDRIDMTEMVHPDIHLEMQDAALETKSGS